MEKKFRFIDLFAGIGGLRIPFENDGQCVFTSEKDPYARETYAQYFGENPEEIDADVQKFETSIPKNFPEHELILAGFPCQPFSHAGKRRGFEDARGTLFFAIANITKERRPRALLLENVRGLLHHDGGNTLSVIRATLEELDYVVHVKILNARDFGLPQNRNRLFIVAIRRDITGAGDFEFPTPTSNRSDLSLGMILETAPSEDLTISDNLWRGHKERKLRNLAKGNGFGYQLFNSDSNYGATISARYYKDGSECLIEQHGRNPRLLTPREVCRLQGFPESFKPHPSKKQAYKQLGNAVPVKVIEAVARSLAPYLRSD